jgi:hypothetical protein
MKIFPIATLATVAMAQKGTMMLDEDVECENFGGKFDKIKGMKPVCTVNKGPIQKKWRCNLKCSNKNENVWSVRPIKCKIKNHPESNRYDENEPTTYKWRPNQIRDAESLCDEKEECGNIRSKYNVTNKLLSWTKTKVNDRQTLFEFSCADWENTENNKVFEMYPFPVTSATCTCNYNKPSNIRCKWSKVKNSIVRCVRKDKPKADHENDEYYYEDMYSYDY